jgi:hypothetical protein
MVTYASAITDLRAHLDEKVTPRYWQDTDLLNWLAQGCTDIARRTETLVEYNTQIDANPAQADYSLPTDTLRVHRIEFIPISTANPPQVYPLELSTFYEMDQRWGASQFLQSVYPSWAVIRGTPGNPLGRGSGALVFKVYPVPSQAGLFNLFYYAMPNNNPATTDTLAVQAGYESLPVLYAEHVALRADRDPRWQEAKQLYEADLEAMIEMTRRLHDQVGQVAFAGGGFSGYSGGYNYDGSW